MINAVEIGNRISIEREKLGITQTELSSLVYVTPQAISKWENGQSIPSVDILARLTILFGITVEELLFSSETEIETLFEGRSREYVMSLILSNRVTFSFEEHIHLFSGEERQILLKFFAERDEELDVDSFWHLLSIDERIYLYEMLTQKQKNRLMLSTVEVKLIKRRKKND
jgi:transcriptional regulator with XRE-family HTH domain